MTDVRTLVLVPGAGGDGRYWDQLTPELERLGSRAIPVTLPAGDESAGWREYADAIVAAAGSELHLVVVAQSLGGFSAPMAAERLEVDRIVLVNAMIPLPGETGTAWWSDTGQGEAQREYLESIGLTPEEAADDRVLYFHDVAEDVVAETFARGEPQQTMTPMHQPWPLDAWPDIPTSVLAGHDDRLFPLAFQRRVARERLGLEAEEIPGGHLAPVSRPRQLAERLVHLAGERLA
jgi:pimeloyl-ACP methyl ester carboxylesterase